MDVTLESHKFDYDIVNNPYLAECDTFSQLATKRVQIRLYKFLTCVDNNTFELFKEDLMLMHGMILKCIATHKSHLNRKPKERFIKYFSNPEKYREILNKEADVKYLFKSIHSALDHMRNCMENRLEVNIKPPINLSEFSRITDRFKI